MPQQHQHQSVTIALIVLAFCALTACTPETNWTADPKRSTHVELSEDLSPAQIEITYAAVEELNAAIGREVLTVCAAHPGSRGRITVTTQPPAPGGAASTGRNDGRAIVRLGSGGYRELVAHELLHALLGSEHSTDPGDVFWEHGARKDRGQSVTDTTVERIQALMDAI